MYKLFIVTVNYGTGNVDRYEILAFNEVHAETIVMNHYTLQNKYYHRVEAREVAE